MNKFFSLSLVALIFASSSAFSAEIPQDKVNLRARTLISKIKQRQKIKSLAPLLRFYLSPERPVQNQNVSIVIRPETTFAGREISVDAKLDGQVYGLDHPSKTLWSMPLGVMKEAKQYEADFSLFIENTEENVDVRDAITELERDITRLGNQIKNERDPVKRKVLQAQRDEKIALKNELVEQLKKYRTKAGSQKFRFRVASAPTDITLPQINSISPKIGPVGGGTLVQVTGINFAQDVSFKVGGVSVETSCESVFVCTFRTPVFASEGAKDVELRQTNDGKLENVVFQNGFFASSSATVKNLRPVAITNGHQEVSLPGPVALNGNQSYDENGDDFGFEWKLVAKPTESTKVVGAVVGNISLVNFTPDVVGTYVFQLITKEVNTDELLESAPALAAALVKAAPPANNPPAPTAPSITVLTGNSSSTDVSPNDPDANQTHMFQIIAGPSHGTANISNTGHVDYQAEFAYVGTDSITVKVTDNGVPPLFGTVTIPISVTTNNHAPVPSVAPVVSHTEAQTFTVFANDPDSSQQHTFTVVTPPAHGALNALGSGNFEFLPTPGYVGADSAVIRVVDNGLPFLSADVAVSLSILANTEPTLSANPIYVASGNSATEQLMVTDPDASQTCTFSLTVPGHGTASVNLAGLVNYTADSGYSGTDSFSASCTDNGRPGKVGQITLSVLVNAPPMGTAPPIATNGETKTSQVTASDPSGSQSLSYAVQNAPVGGAATVTEAGLVTYVPSNNFVGSDTVVIRVSDSGTPVLHVDISIPVTVNPNHAPAPTAAAITVGKNGTKSTQITHNDPDLGQSITYAIATPPTLGTATITSTGIVTYTALSNAVGSDSVEISVADNGHPALVTMITIPVTILANQPPVIVLPLAAVRRNNGPPHEYRFSTNAAVNGVTDPDGTIVNMVWDFGDGTRERTLVTASGVVLHNYMQTGTYTITFTATDNLGASTTATRTLTVGTNDIPIPKFRANTYSGTFPLTVSFDGSESFDTNGIMTYRWFFGSGGEISQASPFINRTFNSPGTYNVRLSLYDPSFADADVTIPITLGGSSGSASPAAGIKFSSGRLATVGSPIAFDGANSFTPTPGASITNYRWNFPDTVGCPTGGCVDMTSAPSFTFGAPRNFFNSLQVTDSLGLNSASLFRETFVVNTGAPPKAILRAPSLSGVAPYTVTFDASESFDYDGTITNYAWFDNTGQVSSGTEKTHAFTFNTPGTYLARVDVTDNDGNINFAFTNVTVLPSALEIKKAGAKKLDPETDPDRELDRQLLTNACGSGHGEACYRLGVMYGEDGDDFTKTNLWQRACSMGYEPACGER